MVRVNKIMEKRSFKHGYYIFDECINSFIISVAESLLVKKKNKNKTCLKTTYLGMMGKPIPS